MQSRMLKIIEKIVIMFLMLMRDQDQKVKTKKENLSHS